MMSTVYEIFLEISNVSGLNHFTSQSVLTKSEAAFTICVNNKEAELNREEGGKSQKA